MGSHKFWLVPHQQHACVSGVWGIAERFWEQGFFPALDLQENWGPGQPASERAGRPHDFLRKREAEWRAAGRPLPHSKLERPFESMSISCRRYKFLIPTYSDTLHFHCPRCQAPITPQHCSTASGGFAFTYGAFVACPACKEQYPATELMSDPSESVWAQFCVSFDDYVYDEPMDDWVAAVQQITGPCMRILSWTS